jgi:FecR-like protein
MSEPDDRYLWDRSGPPDPEIERLERLLGGLGYRVSSHPAKRTAARWVAGAALAMAAGVLVWVLARPHGGPRPDARVPDRAETGSWQVQVITGTPVCDGGPCAGGLAPGAWLVTDAGASARVTIADIGYMDVEPDTRIRLKATGRSEHRLELQRGTISARVAAPPRLLIVETPSADAVDLGCAYRLTVVADGTSRLEVTSGWVALERPGRAAAFVPRGAVCDTHPGTGPGTPYQADAPAALVAALRRLDLAANRAQAAPALETVLAGARVADTLSLWHLLFTVDPGARGRIYDRMVALAPPLVRAPPRTAVLALDAEALAAWKDDLQATW